MTVKENLKEINKYLEKYKLKIELNKIWFVVYRLTIDDDCREWERCFEIPIK